MLALTLRDKDYVFVYHNGTPIGAILFGTERPGGRAKFPVQFAGGQDDFEILRPKVVEARYGKQELQRLILEFCPPSKSSISGQSEESRIERAPTKRTEQPRRKPNLPQEPPEGHWPDAGRCRSGARIPLASGTEGPAC